MKPSDFLELLSDPIRGLFLIIALLCLGYLFAAVKNWADPSKPDPELKRTLMVVALLFFAAAVVFVRADGEEGLSPECRGFETQEECDAIQRALD